MNGGYRGFLAEMLRTGSLRSLALQLRTGLLHVVRRALDGGAKDPVGLFFARYGPDGFRLPSPERRALQLAAERCLVCGLCSFECTRVGGRPRLDPRDAVVAALRSEIDLVRLGLAEEVAGPCTGCAACTALCPVEIPIHEVQNALARLADDSARPAAGDDGHSADAGSL